MSGAGRLSGAARRNAGTTTVTQETDVRVEQNVKNKVDILFMVDNSPSMTPMQAELQDALPRAHQGARRPRAKGNPAWYHIGVVTSDFGAGGHAGGGQCHAGRRRRQAAGARRGADAELRRRRRGGLNFIDYNQLDARHRTTCPPGQDLADDLHLHGVGRRRRAAASSTSSSRSIARCTTHAGRERRLPARRRARSSWSFVTDEDDCSAPPDTDLFDPTKTAHYGALPRTAARSYRRHVRLPGHGSADALRRLGRPAHELPRRAQPDEHHRAELRACRRRPGQVLRHQPLHRLLQELDLGAAAACAPIPATSSSRPSTRRPIRCRASSATPTCRT